MKTHSIMIPFPRLELLVYAETETPNDPKQINLRRRAILRSFMSWILQKRMKGFDTFVIPFAHNPNIRRCILTFEGSLNSLAKIHNVTIKHELPKAPKAEKQSFVCLNNNPFDCIHLHNGKIVLS